MTLDGVDLRQVRLTDLRRAMGCVPQEGFLFSGTVLDNIRWASPTSTFRAEVEAAARAVEADQVIAGLPDGYDTHVGEQGALLAAGERQLVAFARAWIADPALLILDEATSNLDAASEARTTDALQRLRSSRTTIIIAHRLSTIAQADQIAVVEDDIVESGTPAELRAHSGRFAELFDRWVAGAAWATPSLPLPWCHEPSSMRMLLGTLGTSGAGLDGAGDGADPLGGGRAAAGSRGR